MVIAVSDEHEQDFAPHQPRALSLVQALRAELSRLPCAGQRATPVIERKSRRPGESTSIMALGVSPLHAGQTAFAAT
jgi:hypothetical protein